MSERSNSVAVRSQGDTQKLKENASAVRAIEAQAAETGGDFEIIPIDSRLEVFGVRILDPISLGELAQELYGDQGSWQTLLKPKNRWALAGLQDTSRLEAGTTLSIIPEILVEPLQTNVRKLQDLARKTAESDLQALPFITATPQGTLVVNNEGKYAVEWPNHWFLGESANTIIEWWAETDPEAVRTFFVPARVSGPTGLIQSARTFEVPFGAPGAHTIHCRLTVMGGIGGSHDGPEQGQYHLRYTQVVVTLREQTGIKTAQFRGRHPSIEELSKARKAYDNDISLIPSEESDKYMDRIRALETYSKRGTLIGVDAVYVSSDETAASIPLQIFIGPDPSRSEKVDFETFYLKLWDLTPGAQEEYTASGKELNETVKALFEKFGSKAPYPQGIVRVSVPSEPIQWVGLLSYSSWLSEQELTLSTNGGGNLAAFLRAGSLVALGLGIGAAAVGQPEASVPLIWVSGIAAGAGAVVNISDRLERGTFEFDVETAIDLLDIATALVSVRALGAAAQTIRGVGKASLSQRLNTAMGVVQLGLVGEQHVVAINKAIDSKNPQMVKQSLLEALRIGVLVLIVHRVQGGKRGPTAASTGAGPQEQAPQAPLSLKVKPSVPKQTVPSEGGAAKEASQQTPLPPATVFAPQETAPSAAATAKETAPETPVSPKALEAEAPAASAPTTTKKAQAPAAPAPTPLPLGKAKLSGPLRKLATPNEGETFSAYYKRLSELHERLLQEFDDFTKLGGRTKPSVSFEVFEELEEFLKSLKPRANRLQLANEGLASTQAVAAEAKGVVDKLQESYRRKGLGWEPAAMEEKGRLKTTEAEVEAAKQRVAELERLDLLELSWNRDPNAVTADFLNKIKVDAGGKKLIEKFKKPDGSFDDASVAALTKIFEITGRLKGWFFGEVQTRGAVSELETLLDWARRPEVERLEVVAPSNQKGEVSPDFIAHVRQPGGEVTTVRVEVTAATGAKRGDVLSNVQPAEIDYATPIGLKMAITEKLKGGQLTSPKGKMAGVPPKGVLAVHVPRKPPIDTIRAKPGESGNRTPEDAAREAMNELKPDLRNRSELTAVEFYLPDGSVLRYNRSGADYIPSKIRPPRKD